MKELVIVVIGAGSASFGRSVIVDLAQEERLRDFPIALRLVDVDEAALKRMYQFALLVKEKTGASNLTIAATTDRKEALPGADYVIISVSQKRFALWEKDFYIPLAFGFKQVFGENGGPGAAFHTLRSIHLMMPICHDIERLCPEALIVNYTNPESRVCLAIHKLTRLRAVGLCHGPMTTWEVVSDILGRPKESFVLTIGGINHFHWVLGIEDLQGNDLMPEFQRRIHDALPRLNPFVRTMYELYGFLPYPALSHPEEYVHFAYSLTGPLFFQWGIGGIARPLNATVDDLEYAIEGRPNMPSYELWCLEEGRKIEAIVAQKTPLTQDALSPSGELAIPIICDIEHNVPRRAIAANVVNKNRAVANLPEEAIVEVPVIVDGEGIHPIAVGALPPAIAAMCQLQIAIQELLVEAYRERSKKLLLQALLLEPTVDDVKRAQEMMEVMLHVQREYLPEMR